MIVPSPEQQAIIEYPNRPLRVEAGAGTGKTTTVALRVAALVEREGWEPEQVLGVTFTNKAAQELSERIRSLLGDRLPAGRDVEVHTYHGFAAQILAEFGALVGVERDTPVITPTFARQLLADVLARVPLPRLDVTNRRVASQVLKLAAGLADHLLHPEQVTVPEVDDEDDPWFQRADLLAAAVAYRREKRRLGAVDFSDLVVEAHRLVVEHRWVAERITSRYRAVVLDEYQDTNPAQRELLRALFPPGFPVTAVGDPDQTIYEWRGASLENFAEFPEHFPDDEGRAAATLHLTLNRRSGGRILHLANLVRAQIDDRERKPLTPLPDAADDAVTVCWAKTSVDEAEWLAEEMERLAEQGRAWRDMAVLFRKNRDIALVHDALRRRDIPVEVANLGGLLSVPEVVDLHAWLRIVATPDDGPALARILTGSRFRLGLGDLARLAVWVRRAGDPDDDHDRLPARSLLEAVDHLDEVVGLDPRASAQLGRFRHLYRELVEVAQGVTVVELCRRILDRTGAWRDLDALDEGAALSARLNLYRFLDLAEEWSPLEGRPTLDAFLGYLATMEDEPSEELDTARLSGADAVTLLTVHRAKGLEWPVVFIPAVYEKNFPSGPGVYDDPYARPESVPPELRIDRACLPPISAEMDRDDRRRLLADHHLSQEWRIAYVAVTRARERLYLSGAWWYGSPTPRTRAVEPSALWKLAADLPDTQVVSRPEPPAPPRPEILRYDSPGVSAPDPLFGESGWAGALREELARPGWCETRATELGLAAAYDASMDEFTDTLFRLPDPPEPPSDRGLVTSVTALVTYAGCPRRYFWSEVDRLPRRHSPAARRGIEVHRRIELHGRGILALDEMDDASYDVAPEEGAGGTSAYRAFLGSRFAAERPILVEVPFELRLDPALRLRGRIDAIYEPEPGRWEVVDFKTGRRRSDSALVQLQAYAVAVHDVRFVDDPPTDVAVTFVYLGDGVETESYRVDDAWLEDARRRLGELADGIRDERFEATPSSLCEQCDFLRFCEPGREFLGR